MLLHLILLEHLFETCCTVSCMSIIFILTYAAAISTIQSQWLTNKGLFLSTLHIHSWPVMTLLEVVFTSGSRMISLPLAEPLTVKAPERDHEKPHIGFKLFVPSCFT